MTSRLLILLTCLFAACAPLETGQALPALEGDWSITLSQTGGFAGLDRSVTVTADGTVTATDARTGQTETIQLSEADLAALQADVLAAQLGGDVGTAAACADCFVYNLQVDSPAGSFTTTVDDVTLAGSGLEPLITRLRNLLDQALS